MTSVDTSVDTSDPPPLDDMDNPEMCRGPDGDDVRERPQKYSPADAARILQAEERERRQANKRRKKR